MTDEELKKELESKKQELLNKIVDAQSRIDRIDSLISALESKVTQEKPDEQSAKLKEIVQFAIKSAPPTFSLPDIEKLITIHFPEANFPKASIASTFWKMMNEPHKPMKIVRVGTGRNPTIYANPSYDFLER